MTRQDLVDNGYGEVVVFDNSIGYDYDGCIIGVSTDNRAVYSYELMVKFLVNKEGWTEEDAVEWIEYNTIRALPYCENAPVVVHTEIA